MKTDMEEQVQELNDFQKAFRDRELKAGMELSAREEANIEDVEDTVVVGTRKCKIWGVKMS